jgi:hypothetical protein
MTAVLPPTDQEQPTAQEQPVYQVPSTTRQIVKGLCITFLVICLVAFGFVVLMFISSVDAGAAGGCGGG